MKTYAELNSNESLLFSTWCIENKIPHIKNTNFTTYNILFEKYSLYFFRYLENEKKPA